MPNILVVDDSVVIRSLITAALNRCGMTVIECTKGTEVVATCHQYAIDVVILDLELNQESGLDICQQLKADPTTQHIPVILMSGSDLEALNTAHAINGPDLALPKPFSIDEIQAIITKVLQH